ncbi:MAG: hypothetical protein IKF82_01115 [Bacilli bacterium]|nr:hypothetical protein [Bacilli bacterium]
MRLRNDLTGKKINFFTIIERDQSKKFERPQWIVQCQCGKKLSLSGKYLYEKSTFKSCGCHRKNRFLKHNKSKTRLYQIWKHMKERCKNKNDKNYKYYGGKGITICDEWDNDFICFKNWAIKNGYDDNLTIERKNVNLNYCPKNCIWIPLSKQSRNKSITYWVNYKNNEYTLTEISLILNVSRATIRKCLKKGMTIYDIENIRNKYTNKKIYDYYKIYLKEDCK